MKKILKFIKDKTIFLAAITLAAVVGGASTAVVLAAIPDGNGVLHGCYRNSAGLLDPKGNLRIIDSASENCTGQETAVNWDQEGSQTKELKYSVDTTERTLTLAQSEAQNNLVDLSGPEVSVNVPSTAGTLVNFYLSSEAKSPCEIYGYIYIVDEVNGQIIDENMSLYTGPDTSNFMTTSIGGLKAGNWKGVEASPGNHTYGVRYSVLPGGEQDTSCSAYFVNTKLRAEIIEPSS